MTPTATAIATDSKRSRGMEWAIHGAFALWIASAFLLAHFAPETYLGLLQEDRFVEWWTAALFAAAGVLRIPRAWRERRIFDLLIAAFCIFVAGEEFSWGQRLLGFTPPDVFLEHNTQQEFTLHNFADVFGKPKGVLIGALLGFALLALPPLRFLRATPPALALVPWLLGAAGLLYWYPLEFTGEWVEALAGALFLLSAPATAALSRVVPATVLAAGALTLVSAHAADAQPQAVACAQREVAALAADLASDAMPELYERRGSIHKRVWTAIAEGRIDQERLVRYGRVGCGRSQRYAVDPWGMAYWVRAGRVDAEGERVVEVYSMGPDRRRGADIGARFPISLLAPPDM